jgi:hypothetical protein
MQERGYFIRCVLPIIVGLTTAGCDDQNVEQQHSSNYVLQKIAEQTYLLDRTKGNVYVLRAGELVRIPRATFSDGTAESSVKTYNLSVKDLQVGVRLKYVNGGLHYQVTVSPSYTPEYKAYQDEASRRLLAILESPNDKQAGQTTSADAPPLVEPDQKYKDRNWEQYWDVDGNSLTIGLQDSDEFVVNSIGLSLGKGVYATQRTRILDWDNTVSGMSYEGTLASTATDYARISTADVKYILERNKK